MPIIQAKGHQFNLPPIRDSYTRRSQQYQNDIFKLLKSIGVKEDDMDVPLQINPRVNAPASASWYFDDIFMQYDFSTQLKYAENLFVVYKVIEKEVKQLLAKELPINDFISHFSEAQDVEDARKQARVTLELDQNEKDLTIITKRFKQLARQHHPDVDGGDQEEFKKINNAFRLLKRELE